MIEGQRLGRPLEELLDEAPDEMEAFSTWKLAVEAAVRQHGKAAVNS